MQRNLDELKYGYSPLFLPNVQMEWILDEANAKAPKDTPLEVEPNIKELITTLARKHPEWTFVAGYNHIQVDKTYKRDSTGKIECDENGNLLNKELKLFASTFHVFEKREHLGSIYRDQGRGGSLVFGIENVRVAKERERGRDAKTKDIKKAIRIIEKSFGITTIDELLVSTSDEIDTVMRQVLNDRRYRYQRVHEKAIQPLLKYLVDNWDKYSSIACQRGADQQDVDGLMPALDEYRVMKRMYKCVEKLDGFQVLIHGNDYAVRTKGDSGVETKMYSSETLPEHIRKNVGLLKLVENNMVIGGVGMRLNETTFFVVPSGIFETAGND